MPSELSKALDFLMSDKMVEKQTQFMKLPVVDPRDQLIAELQADNAKLKDIALSAVAPWHSAVQLIDELRALIAEKDAALEPFAEEISAWGDGWSDDEHLGHEHGIIVGHLRRAKAARDKREGER